MKLFMAWGLLLTIALIPLAGCSRDIPVKAASDDEGGGATEPVTVEFAKAATRPMDTTVSAQGTLAPAQGASARVAAVVPGRLADVRVREGDHVTAGQVVALVDSRPQQAQARSAAAALTASQSLAQEAQLAAQAAATDQANAVRLARLELASARLDRDNAVKQAQLALDAAQTDLKKTKAGARPQEIAQADQAVRQAQVTRDRASTELKRMDFLYSKGIAAQRQLDDAKAALAVAESALESAKLQASLVKAGARPEDLQATELHVDQAGESLRQAKTAGDAKVAQAQAAVQQAVQSARQVEVKRADARAQLEAANQKRADFVAAQAVAGYAEIRAPLTGIVTRRALNPGDLADTTNPILEITATRSLNLLANLPAEDGMMVSARMPVRVMSPDAPGRTFSGMVLSAGQVDPQTNLMTVRIAVDNPQGVLRVGTFATADIVLRTNPHAVVVPKQAVVTKEGKPVVFVAGPDGVAHQKEVLTGVEQGDQVEIRQGIASGDRVIRLGQYNLSDGAKVQSADEKAKDEKGGDTKEGGTEEKAGKDAGDKKEP